MVSDSKVCQSPIFSADHCYLEEILSEANLNLKAILPVGESYRAKLPALATHIVDALHHINEALAVLKNPQNYVVGKD